MLSTINSLGSFRSLAIPLDLIEYPNAIAGVHVDSKNYTEDELLSSFKYLLNSGEEIRKHLQNVMPRYIDQLNNVASWLFNNK